MDESMLKSEDDEKSKKRIGGVKFHIPQSSKRKRLGRAALKQAKAKATAFENQGGFIERWSFERYNLAEHSMLDIMKEQGATFNNPISRPHLRTAARKQIGDTGLLDHLLKHIEGKPAPDGTHRFRRWFNSSGVMEYWLETADLLQLRREAGVSDPYWIPPPDPVVSPHHLDLINSDLSQLKSDLLILQSNNNQMLKWKAHTDDSLKPILTSWKTMQDMQEGHMAWKAKLEQQLAEIKSLLESKQQGSPQALERWEDWLESTKVEDGIGNEVVPWFEGNTLLNQDCFYSLLPLPSVSIPVETASASMLNRGIQVHEEGKKEDHVNVTLDSCTTGNSMSELHSWASSSSTVCQELFVELFKWKAKMEQKVEEMSNWVNMIRQGQGQEQA